MDEYEPKFRKMLARTTEGQLAAYSGDNTHPALHLDSTNGRMAFGTNLNGKFKLKAGISFPIDSEIPLENILKAEAMSFPEDKRSQIALFLNEQLIYEGSAAK